MPRNRMPLVPDRGIGVAEGASRGDPKWNTTGPRQRKRGGPSDQAEAARTAAECVSKGVGLECPIPRWSKRGRPRE